MPDVDKIISKNWSLSIDTQGIVVEDESDINQCIYIIIYTIPGSDPLRPTFGCNLWKYIDKPINIALPNMVQAILESINKWEPRVSITKVIPTIDSVEPFKVTFDVQWKNISGIKTGRQFINITS